MSALNRLVILSLLLWVFNVGVAFGAEDETDSAQQYVGSEQCSTCHADVAQLWRKSHHALAWTTPTSDNILGNFDQAEFSHQGVNYRFASRNGEFFIESDKEDGGKTAHKVTGVAGFEPLQQYIVDLQNGRQQSHDLVWDTRRGEWYHLYPDQVLKSEDGLHWSGPYKNWNARCAECHATNYIKNYDARQRRYQSTQAEIGVGCEACHGPGSAHIDWAENGTKFQSPKLNQFGFSFAFEPENAEIEIQQCATCHSRREQLGPNSPLPGTNFHDSYNLALLRPQLYHPDGSIKDEVYVYGSFLQSKMYANGVRCTDCHNAHETKLKAEGNAICTQCHSPAGNDRFPSLTKQEYDDPSHHFHQQDSAGAQCVSCHMIERVYMGIDGRRDHSFRVPRPDLTVATGAPNACTDCHKDKTPNWATEILQGNFPNSKNRGPHFATIFAQAWDNPKSQEAELIAIAKDKSTAGIVRATALSALQSTPSADLASQAASLLDDEDPLVRRTAVILQRGASQQQRTQRLANLLRDSVKSVRITAAKEMIGASIQQLPKQFRTELQKASEEFKQSIVAKLDFPETHLIIGGTALTNRNWRAAEAAFKEAVTLDPQQQDAWSMIVRIQEALGNRQQAKRSLDRALQLNPESALLQRVREALRL